MAVKMTLDDLLRDLDMVVFRLEGDPPLDLDKLARDRRRVRGDLEELKDRLEQVLRDL